MAGRPRWRRTRRAFELAGSAPLNLDLPAQPAPPALLGHFDPLLLGYAYRDLVLAHRFAKRIQAGGGFIQPAILVDGRVVGTWRHDRRGERLHVTVEPFEGLRPQGLAAIERDAQDVARFMGYSTALVSLVEP